MKGQLHIFAMLICISIVFNALTLTTVAAEPNSAELPMGKSMTPTATLGISTEAELRDILRADIGGTVILTEDICIEGSDEPFTITNSLTIEMGDNSIRFATFSGLDISGPVHFKGSGIDAPLFTVGFWQNFLLRNGSITATGDNAVAVRLETSASWQEFLFTTISATGSDSVAVQAYDGKVKLTLVDIYAGNGSTALEVIDPADTDYSRLDLFFCIILSDGEFASALPETISLYSCVTSPAPAGIPTFDIYVRALYPVDDYTSKLFFPVGSVVTLPDVIYFEIYYEGQYLDIAFVLPTKLDVQQIDTSAPKEYQISAQVQIPFTSLPVEDFYNIMLPVGIYDPALPYLSTADLMTDETLKFEGAFPEGSSLFGSADAENWSFLMQADGYDLHVNNFLERDVPYYFKVVDSSGALPLESDILKVTLGKNFPASVVGGDRDGDLNPSSPPPTLPEPSEPLPEEPVTVPPTPPEEPVTPINPPENPFEPGLTSPNNPTDAPTTQKVPSTNTSIDNFPDKVDTSFSVRSQTSSLTSKSTVPKSETLWETPTEISLPLPYVSAYNDAVDEITFLETPLLGEHNLEQPHQGESEIAVVLLPTEPDSLIEIPSTKSVSVITVVGVITGGLSLSLWLFRKRFLR